MEYYYLVSYAYENGFAMGYVELDKKIISYQELKEIEWRIYQAKGRKIHPHILNYKLINTKPVKEKKIDIMEAEDYMRFLKTVVDNWRKERI